MKKRLVSLLLALAIALIPLLSLAQANEAVVVTDLMGREVSIASSQRIISLTASGTEILFALGAGDRIIGVDAYSNYPEAVSGIENIVGDYNGPNLELIVALNPDLIIASTTLQAETIEQMTNLGFAVVAAEASSYADVAKSIALIAAATGTDGAPLLEEMANKESLIKEKALSREPVTAYYAVSFGDWGDFSAGPGSFIYDVLTMAGLELITSDSEYPWPMYSLEQIVVKNPDVIILGDEENHAKTIFDLDGYKELEAVKQSRVYWINPDIVSRPAPRVLDAVIALTNQIYGE